MKILNPDFSLDEFFSRAARAGRRLLMLDYDGTLAPFRALRNEAYPYPGVRERLTRLHADPNTRLIVVSGRVVQDLKPLLRMDPFPEIWGSHGAERYLPDAGVEGAFLPRKTIDGLNEIGTWIDRENLDAIAEMKPTGIAFHYRKTGADERNRIREMVTTAWADKIAALGLELHEFDGGIELRVAGINKGDAVRIALKENPQAVVAYLGDDMTDEDAFRALEGKGLRVLVRPELRETEADLHLVPPGELLDFLDRWLAISPAGA